MKNFRIVLIVTLILDIIQFIPLVLAQMGGEMKKQMISDLNIDGLTDSVPGLEVLDMMLYILGFIYLGNLLSVVYTLRLKTLESLNVRFAGRENSHPNPRKKFEEHNFMRSITRQG